MTNVRLAYDRFEEWVRDRSRAGFAVLVGLASALSVLAVSVLVDEATVLDASMMGLSMTAAYYFFDPQDKA